jgi:hypothetical protein
MSSAELPFNITSSRISSETDLTLSESGWLTCAYEAGRTLLWLPVERRGWAWAGHGERAVVGSTVGAMTILELPAKRD